MSKIKTLQQHLIEELGKRTIDSTKIPESVVRNISNRFAIRPYQQKCFQYLINYFEEKFDGKPRQNHQLLFHMATGSGKTLIMAGAILYLYSKGFRNFLFFVNSSNIIDKTRGNFLNTTSSKYLFNESINFGDQQVSVKEVENFQSSQQDEINIVFSTIQGLHMALNNPKENSLTYDDFEDKKIVLLSDEAHHINVDTKKGATKLSQDELLDVVSWEGTVEKIFKANSENILLEFTATIDFQDENLSEKYKPKLIFDYPLREFRADGYSKEVKVLQADLPPFERSLQAILLSQYRKKIFEKNGKSIKPVVLFKSKTIPESREFYAEFSKRLKNLKVDEILAIRNKATEKNFISLFKYFDVQGITFENLITELQEDFSDEKILQINSKDESDEKQLAVNTLEDEHNSYRAVFAVDKLNEGWDVLNLFDIVRLYDTRDAKSNKVGKGTMSEAQLIGRGARYCPFTLNDKQQPFQRKYDSDLSNELRICEELIYHSAHNPRYIQELSSALHEIGILAKEIKQKNLFVKSEFKESKIYKAGHIFLNSKIKYLREDITGLDASLITQRHKVEIATGLSNSFDVFSDEKLNLSLGTKRSKDYDFINLGKNVIRKAIQKIHFYEFGNLKSYLPNLSSINEFIESKNYLGNLKLEVSGLEEDVENLSSDNKLQIATDILLKISSVISSDKIEFKGSKKFTPFMIKETFTDKVLNFNLDDGSDKQFGRSMNDLSEAGNSYHLDLSTKNWYIFNDCYGTSEEKLLIKFIDKRYSDMKKKYSDIYLLRNERHFQIYNFSDGRPLEPDFVLYLIGMSSEDTGHYQVFIEPKGAHLLKADEWKEQFLISIKNDFQIEQLFENKKYVVWGLPFFNNEERIEEFEEGFNQLLDT